MKKEKIRKKRLRDPGILEHCKALVACFWTTAMAARTSILNEFLFLPLHIIITANIKYLIHVTREFYFAKVICRNLYALFSNVRRAYTVNKNGVQLFITGGRITNQRKRKCLWPIKAVNRLHAHAWLSFIAAPSTCTSWSETGKTKKNYNRFGSILGWLVYSSYEFVRHQSMFLTRCSSDLFKKIN